MRPSKAKLMALHSAEVAGKEEKEGGVLAAGPAVRFESVGPGLQLLEGGFGVRQTKESASAAAAMSRGIEHIKLLVTGTGSVGKTCMLITGTTGHFPQA